MVGPPNTGTDDRISDVRLAGIATTPDVESVRLGWGCAQDRVVDDPRDPSSLGDKGGLTSRAASPRPPSYIAPESGSLLRSEEVRTDPAGDRPSRPRRPSARSRHAARTSSWAASRAGRARALRSERCSSAIGTRESCATHRTWDPASNARAWAHVVVASLLNIVHPPIRNTQSSEYQNHFALSTAGIGIFLIGNIPVWPPYVEKLSLRRVHIYKLRTFLVIRNSALHGSQPEEPELQSRPQARVAPANRLLQLRLSRQ